MTPEQHYTVSQIAEWWAVAENTVRRAFTLEPGVLKISNRRSLTSKREKVTLRIPASVYDRVYRQRTSGSLSLEVKRRRSGI